MILNNKVNEAISIGGLNTTEMTIDKGDERILMKILSEGLYRDPIGSTIREWTSNALDSHVEAGVDEPVIVSIKKDDNWTWWLRIQDFGVGISPDRQENVVSKYASSTKRHDNTMLGAFGLGLKAGLSYTDSFTYITNYNGKQYTYLMYKGEEKTNIDLLMEKDTTERNGTTFILQIKNSDASEFIEKARQQLCYFEKVYFDCSSIKNDFTIYKGDGWKASTLNEDDNMHLCLDNVYYPINFHSLGISSISIPIGLDFKIGEGLVPVPSREDIMYTPSSKALIIGKIKEACTQFVKKYNEGVVEKKNFLDILKNVGYAYGIIPELGEKFDLSIAEKYSMVEVQPPTMEGIKLLSINEICKKSSYLLNNYEIRGIISGGTFKGKYEEPGYRIVDNLLSTKYILATERPKGVHLEYLKEKYSSCKFVYKRYEKVLNGKLGYWYGGRDSMVDYTNLLDLKKFPKNQWRERIKEFKIIEDQLLSKFIPIESTVPTAEWLEIRKNNRTLGNRTEVGKETIFPKWAERGQRGDVLCTFVHSRTFTLEEIRKHPRLNVYGTMEQKELLEKAYIIGQTNSRVRAVMVSQRDYTKLEKVKFHNWINISKFMEGKSKPFIIYCTALLLNKLKSDHLKLWEKKEYIGLLSTDLLEKMKIVGEVVNKNYRYCDSSLQTDILAFAKENNLFDAGYLALYNELKEILPKFDFVSVMELPSYKGNLTPAHMKLGVDILKYRKVKLNLNHYESPKPVETKAEIVTEGWEPDGEEEDEVGEFEEFDIEDKANVVI